MGRTCRGQGKEWAFIETTRLDNFVSVLHTETWIWLQTTQASIAVEHIEGKNGSKLVQPFEIIMPRWGRTRYGQGCPGQGKEWAFIETTMTWHFSFGSPYRNLVSVADYTSEHSGRACRGKKWVKTRAAIWNSHAIRGFTEDALTGAQCVGRLVSWFIFNPIFGKNLAFTAACHLIQFKFYYKSFP